MNNINVNYKNFLILKIMKIFWIKYIDKIEDKLDIEKFGEEYHKLKDKSRIKNNKIEN